jgi:hypothetical protein
MKRLIGFGALLCLLAFMVGCGGVSSTGTLAYISNSNGTGFTVYTVNTDGTLTRASISPQSMPAGPMMLQFTANGKWAYFLDKGGQNIYGYKRNGDGSMTTKIDAYPVSSASAIALSPNSNYLYVALPNVQYGSQKGELWVYSIDANAGILNFQANSVVQTIPIDQLIMNSSGTILYGLSKEKQTVVAFTITSTNGNAVQSATTPTGPSPSWMILSANGSYMYVLDRYATTQLPTPQSTSSSCPSTNAPRDLCSPNIYGYTTTSTGSLTPMSGSPFNENYDLLTYQYPANPMGGATSADSRYLFVTNQGSMNVSVFKISTSVQVSPGEPIEITGSVTNTNGVETSTASPFPVPCPASSSTPNCAPGFTLVAGQNNGLFILDSNASRIYQMRVDLNTGRLRSQSPSYVSGETSSSTPTWITVR